MKLPLSRNTGPGFTGAGARKRRDRHWSWHPGHRTPACRRAASTVDRQGGSTAAPAARRGGETRQERCLAAWPRPWRPDTPARRGRSVFGPFCYHASTHDNSQQTITSEAGGRVSSSAWRGGIVTPSAAPGPTGQRPAVRRQSPPAPGRLTNEMVHAGSTRVAAGFFEAPTANLDIGPLHSPLSQRTTIVPLRRGGRELKLPRRESA